MKYLLSKFIHLLDGKEMRHFKIYNSNFLQNGEEKRTTELLNILQKGKQDEYDTELVKRLFKNRRQNSYYRLKSRLLHDLEDSLLTFHSKKDEESIIQNYIRLSDIFIGKTGYDIAEYYLKEAEKLALQHEHYGYLNIVYDKLINLSFLNQHINPAVYVKKKQETRSKYEQVQRLELLLATLTYRLHRSNFSSKDEGVVELLESVLDEMHVSVTDSKKPGIRMRIHQCTRQILLQKREFKPLLEYLHKSYDEFEVDVFFDKKNHEDKIVLLIWLINTTSKLRQIDKTIIYTEDLKNNIEAYNQLYYNKYVWLYYQSRIVILTAEGQPEQAIQMLEELLNTPKYQNILSFFSIYLNLALLYFYKEDINTCLDYLSKVIVSKDYKSLSSNLQLIISILEIVFHLEREDYQFASGRYKNIRRKYRKELKSSGYKEQEDFLMILKDFVSKPDAVKHKRILHKINRFTDLYPHFEIGANELLNYNLWLQSKVQRKPYYQLMLSRYYQSA